MSPARASQAKATSRSRPSNSSDRSETRDLADTPGAVKHAPGNNSKGERRELEKPAQPQVKDRAAPPMERARKGPSGTAATQSPDPHSIVGDDGRPGTLSRAAAGAKSDGTPAIVDRGGRKADVQCREARQAVTSKPKPWRDMTATEKRAAVTPLLRAGRTYGQIAAELGATSRSSIASVVDRMAEKRPAPEPCPDQPAPKTPWASLSAREKEAAVSDLLSAGLRPVDIARRLGAPEESISTVVRRLRVPTRTMEARLAASKDLEAKVLALVADGFSAAQIAQKLHLASRCAVSGIIYRARARGADVPTVKHGKRPSKARPPRSAPSLPPRPKTLAKSAAGIVAKPMRALPRSSPPKGTHAAGIFSAIKARKVPAENRPPVTIDRANAFDPIPGTTPIGIMKLNSQTCCWPVNGLYGRGDLYCGQTRDEGNSYCGDHRRLGTAAPTERTKQLEAEPA